MITDFTYFPYDPLVDAWLAGEEPTWCGSCGSAEDPCDCYSRAFTAVDELGVPFRANEGAIWASMSAALLDIRHIDR